MHRYREWGFNLPRDSKGDGDKDCIQVWRKNELESWSCWVLFQLLETTHHRSTSANAGCGQSKGRFSVYQTQQNIKMIKLVGRQEVHI